MIRALIACLFLAGCATAPVRTVEVRVPVPVRCAVDAGPDPAFVDTKEALQSARDVFERVRLLLAGRAQRDARIAELRAAAAGCR